MENALHSVLSSWPQLPPNQAKKVVELLIKKGADLNGKAKDGSSPLHLAAERGEMSELMELLLKNGAVPNQTDGSGETPLHRAARHDNKEGCKILLAYGADSGLASHSGYTAAQLGGQGVVKVIQEPPGMDLERQLLEASRTGDLDTVIKILTQRPDIVNCRDVEGRNSTPLHFASGRSRRVNSPKEVI